MNTSPGLSFASVRRFLLCLLAALVATACGQRGPLYLPQPERQPEPRSEPSSEPGLQQQSAPTTQPGDPADEDREEESREQQ